MVVWSDRGDTEGKANTQWGTDILWGRYKGEKDNQERQDSRRRDAKFPDNIMCCMYFTIRTNKQLLIMKGVNIDRKKLWDRSVYARAGS